jgi:hypothetical protein
MTPDDHGKYPASPQTFRLEDDNVATVVRLARADGITKSDWYRRAVLAQIVCELVEIKREDAAMTSTKELGDQFVATGEALLTAIARDDPPVKPDEVPHETSSPQRKVEGVGHRANRWS